jgi:hypothetical protein
LKEEVLDCTHFWKGYGLVIRQTMEWSCLRVLSALIWRFMSFLVFTDFINLQSFLILRVAWHGTSVALQRHLNLKTFNLRVVTGNGFDEESIIVEISWLWSDMKSPVGQVACGV